MSFDIPSSIENVWAIGSEKSLPPPLLLLVIHASFSEVISLLGDGLGGGGGGGAGLGAGGAGGLGRGGGGGIGIRDDVRFFLDFVDT